ncbi:MAG: DUF5658 family protein [Myxococcales bacterium]
MTILVVAGAPAPEGALTAPDAASALQILAQRRVDAIVAPMRLGLEFLRKCASVQPDARRIVLAAYEQLPELVRTRGLASRVLPESADAARVAKAVRAALTGGEDASVSRVPAPPELDELLRWTALRLAQVKGAVVRPLPPDPRALQLQFVLPAGQRLEALRQDVLRQWLWPVKPRDAKVARKDRDHPVVRMLGWLSPGSEVYAREDAYVALLPWQREKRVTAALGVLRPDWWELLRSVHAEAIAALSEFELPALDEATGTGAVVPEYDWIITPDYVGPDRRVAPTGFLNRFVFLGRRRRVPSRIASGHFTDRPDPAVWSWLALYLVLAGIDTWLTYRSVRSGLVQEANPLLRPLVLHHPWAFLIVKNALAIGAFFAIARFHLFRAGRWALPAVVIAYLLLDLYWAILLR